MREWKMRKMTLMKMIVMKTKNEEDMSVYEEEGEHNESVYDYSPEEEEAE